MNFYKHYYFIKKYHLFQYEFTTNINQQIFLMYFYTKKAVKSIC
jgi:hypothetical protein